MPIVARLTNQGRLFAFEFDDNSSNPFNISSESTVFAIDIDENTTSSLSGNQRMSSNSSGELFVLDEIDELGNFAEVDTTNLELNLDSIDSQFTTASGLPTGQQLFTSNGTFTVPDDVTSISVVCVGGGGGGGTSDQDDELGGGGGGGALAYVNNITTTPGESLTITVGAGGAAGGGNGGNSSLSRGGTTLCSAGGGQGGDDVDSGGDGGNGGTVITGTGGSGGSGGDANDGTSNNGGGGGGAGGYSGAGGNGANNNSTAAGGDGAGGAAGGAGRNAGGGGVGVLGGELINGLGGAAGIGGGGGTGGADGGNSANGDGGLYGGGGAGASDENGAGSDNGANGVVRIIWGPSRTFPSDLTGDAVILNTPVWNDLSGNNRHATLLNGANRITTFVKFDGIDDYGKTDGAIGSAYNGVTGTSARTSILYFRVSVPNTDYRPLAWGATTTGQKWTMAINSSNLMRGEVAGAAIEQPTTHRDNVVNVADGFFHMVAISAPASGTVNDMRMWIDGEEVTGLTFTNGTQTINTANTNNVAIGASLADTAPRYLDGQIAKVMVYSRALSDFDIKTIYQSLISKFPFSPTTPFGASFNFRYHAFGSAIGTTTFYWYNTTTSTLNELTSIIGQQQTSSNAPWSDIQSIPLDSYDGETGRIVIRYQTGPGFQQDFAIDDMQLINTSLGTIDLDPSTTQPNGGWQQQGIRNGGGTYPTTGYSALTTNQQDPNDFWQYDVGGTPSNNTGPSTDSDGSATGFYIYFEGTNPNSNTGHNAWLQTSSTYTLGGGTEGGTEGGTGGGGGLTTGLTSSLLQLTGISASYTQRTVDLSAYANATIRLVWRVVVGTTGDVFQNDVQIDTIAITGESVSYDFDAGTESFETTTNGSDTDYSTATFTALGTTTTAERWNRNSGNTGSNNTGNLGAQSGTFYVYTETSNPVINGDYFWLRSPEITLGATPGNVTFYEGRQITGTTTTLDFYVDVVSV